MAYRGPSKQRSIRKVVTSNTSGDAYAISIPKPIAEQFSNVKFKILIYGTSLILQSGADIRGNK